MKKSRFSEERMVRILREADWSSVSDAAKQNGASKQTIWTWRTACRSTGSVPCPALRQLERENAWLKRLVAARDLEADVMKEIQASMVSVPACHRQIAFACRRGLSQRREFALLSAARSSSC